MNHCLPQKISLERSFWVMMPTKNLGCFEMTTDLCLEWLFEISVWSNWPEFGMTPHMLLEWFFHLESDLSNNRNDPTWKLLDSLDLLNFIQLCHIFSHLHHLQTSNFVITFLFKLAFIQLWTDLAINGITQRNFKRYSSFIPLFCQLELQCSMILCFELLVSENDTKFQWHWGQITLLNLGWCTCTGTKHMNWDLVITYIYIYIYDDASQLHPPNKSYTCGVSQCHDALIMDCPEDLGAKQPTARSSCTSVPW